MNALLSPRFNRASQSAFTLIELLVVITIIAVLAGLLLPVSQSVLKSARKTSAKSTEQMIVASVNNYQTEYGQYPVPIIADSDGTKDYTFDKDKHNSELFDVLRGLNNTQDPNSPTGSLNTRKVTYFESKNAKSVSAPRDGFVASVNGSPQDSSGNSLRVGDFIDPFGNLYFVRIDANYSNAVKNPYADESQDATDDPGAPQANLRTGVIVYSYGFDSKKGDNGDSVQTPYTPTPGDDVDSWQ